MRKAPTIELDDKQRMELERLSRSRSTSVRLAERSRIVLLAAEGRNNYEIAARLEITRQKAGRWRNRFVEQGLAGIEKDPIYLSMLCLHIGLAIWSNSAWFFVTALSSFVLLTWGVISREEQYLERKFGSEYLDSLVSGTRCKSPRQVTDEQ